MIMLAITGASISPVRKMMKNPASRTTARPMTCGSARWRSNQARIDSIAIAGKYGEIRGQYTPLL